jgi:hypothetical protein
MATFNQSLTRIRRFLRDPDGNIWTDDQIRYFWNDAQQKVALDTHLLVNAETLAFPPAPSYSYTHRWEEQYTDSATDMRVLEYGQDINKVYTYPWEFAWSGTNPPKDEGSYRWTHPFEGTMYTTAKPVPNILNKGFVSGIWCAYDQEEILPLSRDQVASGDRWYRHRKGEAKYYYRDSDYANTIVIYPQPPPDYSATSVGDLTDSTYVTTTDRVVIVYKYAHADIPSGSGNWDDTLDWPDWAIPYIEYATLERAYGADTDGYIPTLHEYWKLRYDVGLQILKRLQSLWLKDKKLVMGGIKRRPKPSGPSLGSHYPRMHR